MKINNIWLFAAIIALSGCTSSDSDPVSEIIEPPVETVPTTKLQIVHASADAPAVDVIVNDNFAEPVVSNLAFPDFAGYLTEVVPDTYNVKVTAAGTESAVIDADLTIEAGVAYNVLAVNNLENIEPLIVTADNRRIATEAKLRIIHASPTAQDVDIYLVASGTDFTTVSPTLANVPFKADTNFLSVSPGTYDVVVAQAGSDVAAIGPATITLDGNGIYTLVARDAIGGGVPLNIILMDDFE